MKMFFRARFLELVAGKEATSGRLRKILSTLLLLGSLIPLAVFAQGAPDTIVNWAAAAQGGTATASKSNNGYPASSVNDGDRIGATFGHGGGWQGKSNGSSDWVQVSFASARTINTVTVYSPQDNLTQAVEPTESLTFTQVGAVGFEVQVPAGNNNWTTVATVAGNGLVKRSVSFAAVNTTAIRIVSTASAKSGFGIVEIEAWGAAGIGNVAAARAQAVARANSSYGPMFPASALNDNVTSGAHWGLAQDGGWANGSGDLFPNRVEVVFPVLQVVNAITLWTLQDDYAAASPVDDSTVFNQYGLTAFDVQVLTNDWVTVASITGNNLVKRTVTFAPTAASRVRIVNKAGLQGYARIVELQAWGVPAVGVARLTGMEPRSGQVGDTVTLYGENFSTTPQANLVTFNSVAAKVIQADAHTLKVTVPNGATTGLVNVAINGWTTGTEVPFEVTSGLSALAAASGPTITNFSPASGAPGTVVTITGTGFSATASQNTVTFGGRPGIGTTAVIQTANTTTLKVVAPGGASTGLIWVTVGGLQASTVGAYEYPPVINYIDPTSGAVGDGVTISGSNLGRAKYATFGGGAVQNFISLLDQSNIVVVVPAGAQSGPITVTSSSGLVSNASSSFTVVIPSPTITDINPTSGLVGSTVTITGTNFDTTPANNSVKFNGTAATVTAATSTSLTVTVPNGATTGAVSVTVNGMTVSGPTFTVQVPTPTISSLSPASGPRGSTVVINGTNFSPTLANNQVFFTDASTGNMGIGASITAATTTALTVIVPTGAGSGSVWVAVTGAVNMATSPWAFTVTVPIPTITGFSPQLGPVGTSVTITGTNFGATAASNVVKFNGTVATITAASTTSLTATVPSGASSGPISVTVSSTQSGIGSQTVTSSSSYTVGYPQPTCTSQAPQNPTVPATAATQRIFAYGVQNATSVVFPTWWVPGNQADIQWLQGVNAGGGTWYVDVPLSQYDPGTPRYGTFTTHVYLSNPNYSNAWCGGGNWTRSPPSPEITSINPTSGTVGTTVTISGNNFDPTVANNSVKFNGTAATVTAATSTSLTTTVPTGATTGVVSVTVNGMTATGPTFTVQLPSPTISSLSPASGPRGSTVVINGTNFSSTLANNQVFFTDASTGNSGLGASITVATATALTVVVPAGAGTGSVSVSVTGAVDTATSPTVFTVTVPQPTITGFSPSIGPAGTSVIITGTNFGTTAARNLVKFNGTAATVTAASATSLTATVPTGATSGPIAVTVSSGQTGVESLTVTSSGSYTVGFPPMTITGFTPVNGPVGTQVTISGTNFGANQGIGNIQLNGSAIGVDSWSDTAIKVTIPAGATSGPFMVVNGLRQNVTSSAPFTVTLPPPTVTGLSPTSGGIGVTVTVTGTNFSPTLTDDHVQFNGVAAAVTAATSTTLTTTVPSGATTGAVSVNIAGQSATGPTFTVLVPPTISGFSPQSGSVGTVVTISGANFATTAAANTVSFNGVNTTPTTATSTSLTVAVPNNASTGPLGVTANGFAVTSSGTFTVIPLTQTITWGTAPNVRVGVYSTLTATGGGSGNPVVFASTTPSICTVTGTQVLGVAVGTCTVTADQAGNNTYTAAPQSSQSFAVAQGTQIISLGTSPTVTVGGSGTVTAYGGASGNPVIVASTTPSVCSVTGTTVYGLAAGNCALTYNQAGNANYQAAAQVTQNFSILAQPTISSVTPIQGPPNTVITINGTNFSTVASGNVVTINGVQATVLTANATVLTARVPPNATTGAIVLTVGSLSANGGTFTVTPAPVVSGFTPFGGNVGDTIQINGFNFSSIAANNIVKFNGATASVTGASSTSLTAVVPSGATTGPITVTVGGQTGTSPLNFFILQSNSFPSTASCGTTLPPVDPGSNPGQPGFWWNPKRSGTSWTFHFNGQGGFAVYWYTFDGNGRPVMLGNFGQALVNAAYPNQYYVPLSRVTVDPQTGNGTFTSVGQAWIAFVPGTNTNAAVRWQWNDYSYGQTPNGSSFGADECVYNFFNTTQGSVKTSSLATLNSSSALDASYTGLWTPSGSKSGWGLDVTVATCANNPAFICSSGQTYEFDGVLIYDTAGNGTWMVAQNTNNPPLVGTTSIPLDYGRSKYPHGFPDSDCATGCVTHYNINSSPSNDSGTLTRTFTGNSSMSATLTATVPSSITGGDPIVWPLPAWTAATTMGKSLTEDPLVTVSESYCATTCTITVSWMTGLTTAHLYKRDLSTNTISLFNSSYSGSAPDTLATGSDVQYELRDGSSTGTLLYRSTEVKVGNPAQAAPYISSFTPISGPAGTTVVTIQGSNFDPTPGNNIVKFNNSSNATVQSATATSLVVLVPSNATTGTITVTVNGKTGTSSQIFTIGNNVPAITGFSPTGGVAGTQVTITGSNFSTTASQNTVLFTGTSIAATILGTPTATTLVVIAPTGVQTGPISVTVGGNTATSSTPFVVQSNPQGTPTSAAPIATSTPSTDAISDAVGATAAQFRVDEGGNATYSMPIQVPPGTAGVVPKLALSYNSRMPNGVMGPGWSIEGSSQISRCRQTRESGDFGMADGNPSPVNFTQTDRFCLDGVRLLLLSGSINSGKSYGDNGTVYSPENDPTTRVTATVTNVAAGPDSFTVQRKDGTASTYGNTSASSNALSIAIPSGGSASVNVSWSLARVQDSAGNYIDYLYNARPGTDKYSFLSAAVETTLAQVNYTGNAAQGVTPYASVVFNYATVLNTASSPSFMRMGYQAGVMFAQSQQLQSVTVSDSDHGELRFYTLQYGSSTSGSGFQQLQSVKECRDSTQSVCFRPTLFSWSQANNLLIEDAGPGENNPAIQGMTQLVGLKFADVDGDGRMDLVWATNDGSCSSSGGGSRIRVGFVTAVGGSTTLDSRQGPCAPIDLTNNDRAWYLIDYDGDGRADLLVGGGAGSNWALYLSNGRSTPVFDTTDQLSAGSHPLASPIAVPSSMSAAVGIVADLNGDGLPDFIYPADPTVSPYQDLLARELVRQSNGSLSFSAPMAVRLNASLCEQTDIDYCTYNIFYNPAQHRSAIVSDVNGDGRADLTVVVRAVPAGQGCQTCRASTSSGPKMRFDPLLGQPVETSGFAAMTTSSGGAYWYQFVASGTSQISLPVPLTVLEFNEYWSQSINASALPSTSDKLFIVDLTGDGLTDILYQDSSDSSGQTYRVLVNTGNGYTAPVQLTLSGIDNNGSPDLQFADVNGDGKADVVYHGSATGDGNVNHSHSYSYVSLTTTAAAQWVATTPATVAGWAVHNSSSSISWVGILGDIDGDGSTDLFQYELHISDKTVYNYSLSHGASCTNNSTLNCSRYRPRDVVTTITNGLGAQTTLTYQPLTNGAVYQRGGASGYPALITATYGWGSPVFDVLAPMYVVSQATSNAPTQASATATSTVSYRYAGAAMQAGGRGFLGFREVWAFDGNDIATGKYVATVNRYAQTYPFIGMPVQTIKEVFSGGSVSYGNAALNACAANIETTSYNCFAAVTGNTGSGLNFQTTWPDLTASGIWVTQGQQTPMCNGPGCAAALATPQCSIGASVPSFSVTSSGGFAPPTQASPIFAYVGAMGDTQYDLGTGTVGSPAAYASVYNTFCYDGTASTPSKGELLNSVTLTADAAGSIVAQKSTSNTYAGDNGAKWYLGRLSQSIVNFSRPTGAQPGSRTTSYTYDATTGLLTSERIQSGGSADQDLRTLYVLDGFGNRTGAYQCSQGVSEAQCLAGAANGAFAQQQTSSTVLRYAKTTYASNGRYVTGSTVPFASVGGGWNEQQATYVDARDEFGNAIQQHSINGTTQTALFGAMGRPYFSKDNIGHASTTIFRMCGNGPNQVSCGSDAHFVFRSQTTTAGSASSWTYFDVLGRPVMKVAQAFDNNPGNQQFTASCGFADAHNRPIYQSEPFFLTASTAGDGSPVFSGTPCNSASYATTTTYDVLGRVITVTTPDGTTTSSYAGLSTFVTNARGFSWEAITNEMGEPVQTLDPGTVNYDTATALVVAQSYDQAGNLVSITRNAGNGDVTSSFTYDALGRKLTQTDADSGTTTFTYNAAGDVITQKDAKNQTVALSYDAMGRKWQRVASSTSGDWTGTITDTWSYDTAANGYGQLTTETHTGTGDQNLTRTMIYDGYGRLYQRQHVLSGSGTYTETTALDGYSRPWQQQDATGQITTTHYTARGFADRQNDSRLTTSVQSGAIDAGVGGRLYELLQTNERGQPLTERRGGSTYLQTSLSYYAKNGRLKGACTNGNAGPCGLQDDQYAYDSVGNVIARLKNASSGKSPLEQLTYDGLNRLTKSQLGTLSGVIDNGSVINVIGTQTMTYDSLGNLCTQAMTGTGVTNTTQTYTYAGPAGCTNHGSTGSAARVTQISGTVNQTYQYDANGNQTTRGDGRALTYNALNQAVKAVLGGNATTFQYSPGGERYLRNDNGVLTLYIGKVEITISGGTTTEQRRYLGVAIDLVIANDTRYVLTDHLGSTNVIAHADGTKYESEAFDAWGNRRDPGTWTQTGTPGPITTTPHGFTGQEGVEAMGIIHFNGRIYDPQMGRMLQADPVQNPGSQGLNRYAYVANNPLTLTDPTGYSFWNWVKVAAAVAITVWTGGAAAGLLASGSFWSGLAVAAAGGFAAGVVTTGTLQGGLIGAFTAAAFYGVGSAFQNAGWAHDTGVSCSKDLTTVGSTAKVIAHGVVGGVTSVLQGGKFGSGFISAGVTEAFSPSAGRINTTAGQIATAAMVGGTASALSGGKFANGAVTSAMAMAFNHVAHSVEEKINSRKNGAREYLQSLEARAEDSNSKVSLSVNTNGDNHAWLQLEITDINGGVETHTFGAWEESYTESLHNGRYIPGGLKLGPSEDGGVYIDTEFDKGYKATSSYSMQLTGDQVRSFFGYVGANHSYSWLIPPRYTCVTFAAEGWQATTGVSLYYRAWSPAALGSSIDKLKSSLGN